MIIAFLFSLILSSSNNLLVNRNLAGNEMQLDLHFLQMKNAYATTTNNTNNNNFNFIAVGDWDCTDETEDTIDNIIDKNPELVLALGDLSYDNSAECWLELIEPIRDKTKIALGNHESESSEKLEDFMESFELEKQYYSFNYENVHFLALSTEVPYDDDSQQYEFAINDLEKYSTDSSIDWIVVFFHRQSYSSAAFLEDEEDFRDTYHPLFDKYKVDLALQGHLHAYERTHPINFNSDDENEPIIKDTDPNLYENPTGTIFITVGTGGAHEMELANNKDFSAAGIDNEFGILNINVENDNNDSNLRILTGNFIQNEDDEEYNILDQFKITK
jgi:Calcineurin-like phosphoesterase